MCENFYKDLNSKLKSIYSRGEIVETAKAFSSYPGLDMFDLNPFCQFIKNLVTNYEAN
jgi:hypothetical protein